MKNHLIDQCIFALASGDIDAMDQLYNLIKNDVYAFALSKVGNKFDADDITQDTFVRIYENAKLYQSVGKPLAWIFKLETNIINKFFDKKNKELIDIEMVENITSNYGEESKIINSELLKELLKRLDDFEREVISLHIVSDLKFREIAQILKKPLSTVLSKYNRAIKKLQKIVKEENYE